MLLSLSIKNYALIEALEIDFSNKLSIITGETGAGKSILLGAIGLVLGNRADLNSLKNETEKCIIEAQFSIANYSLQNIFETNDLDYEAVTIIRREILPSGKSRAFVNDSPVNLSALQELSNYLIDVHSQHQTRDLLNEDFQLHILDALAKNENNLTTYQNYFSNLKKKQKELQFLTDEKATLVKEQEYNNFLLQELLSAQLKENEQETLEEELEQLSNVELIKENLDKVLALSTEEQIGVNENLTEIKNALQKITNFSKNYTELYERIVSLTIEFQDVIDECFSVNEKVLNDPERLEVVSNKLQTIYNLQKKHNVNSVEELLAIQTELDEKVVKVDDLEQTIQKLTKEVEVLQNDVITSAKIITESRVEVAPKLAQKIEVIIHQLGMPDAKVEFVLKKLDNFTKTGIDTVAFLFSANKGMNVGAVKKTASGGEMSRIMLAVKSILADYSNLPTIIFDEIDTGVSGEIALKMGEIMQKMSQNRQVFAITHLPQIAAKGNQHYKVFKYNQAETTVSEIKLLSNDERVVEVAEMLSGKNITDSALTHARTLLN